MFISFSNELQIVLNNAKKEMKALKHSYIGTEHFVLSLLSTKNSVSVVLNKLGITYDSFKEKVISFLGYGSEKTELYVFTPLFKNIIERSIYACSDENKNELDLTSLFALMLSE